MASLAFPDRPRPVTSAEALPTPAVDALTDGLTRLLDDLHARLVDEQLRTLARLRLEPGDLLALGRLGAAPGVSVDEDAQTLARLHTRELAEPSGRGGWRPTAAGRKLLDDLHEARTRAIRRFVSSLDRARRLRLAGALHLLSADLDGAAVVGG